MPVTCSATDPVSSSPCGPRSLRPVALTAPGPLLGAPGRPWPPRVLGACSRSLRLSCLALTVETGAQLPSSPQGSVTWSSGPKNVPPVASWAVAWPSKLHYLLHVQ